jgi:hypothetical protein
MFFVREGVPAGLRLCLVTVFMAGASIGESSTEKNSYSQSGWAARLTSGALAGNDPIETVGDDKEGEGKSAPFTSFLLEYGGVGAVGSGTTSLSIPYPASVAAGDLLIVCIANKHDVVPDLPAGWTLPVNGHGSNEGAGGTALDQGYGKSTVFVKQAQGTETGSLPVTIPSGNSAIGAMARYTKSAGGVWSYAAANGVENTEGTTWSVSAGSDPGVTVGDIVIACSGVNTNGPSFSSPAISQPGIVYGTSTALVDAGTALGNDSKVVMSEHRITSGVSSGVPTFAMMANRSDTNSPEGSTVLLRIREVSEPDGTPPVRSNGAPSGILPEGTTAAVLSLTTDESASCKYGAVPDVAYEFIASIFSTTGGTSHSSQITGLLTGNTYSYFVRCSDTTGHTNTIDYEISFSIAADATPPVITILAPTVSSSGATIRWATSEVADAQVEYGLTTAYGSETTLGSALVTSHIQSFSGLSSGRLYHYRVKSRDAAGNLAVSADDVFTTFPNAGIVFGGIGATVSGSTSLSIPYPVSVVAGDLLMVCIANKHDVVPAVPAGWILPANGHGSNAGDGGSTSDQGYGRSTVFIKEAQGTEAGSLLVSIPSGNAAVGAMIRYTKDWGIPWSYAAANGADDIQGMSWYVSAGSDPGVTVGDIVIACSGINGDGPSFSAQTISQLGVVYGTATERVDTGTTLGSHLKVVISEHRITSGVSLGAPTFRMTASQSGMNSPEGSSVLLRIREIAPPDNGTPLVRSNGAPSGVLPAGTAITLSLTTGESATCKYGVMPDVAYEFIANTFSNTGGTSHSNQLTGLLPGNTYTYFVRCSGTTGNTNTTDYAIGFSIAADATPVITILAPAVSSSGAAIRWTTDEISDSQVEYGLTTAYGLETTLNPSLVTTHIQDVTGLNSGTLYHYRVKSRDAAGNLAVSADNVFTTAPSPGVAFGGIGGTADGSTSLSIPYPSTIAAGDLLIVCIASKDDAVPAVPAGWMLPANGQGSNAGDGGSTPDRGYGRSTVFIKSAQGTETGSLLVTIPSGNSAIGAMARYVKGGGFWSYAAANGRDDIQGVGWFISAGSDPGITAGDIVFVCSGVNSDDPSFAAQAITQSGVVYGTATERVDAGTSEGNDSKVVISEHPVAAGASWGVPAFKMAASQSSVNSPEGSSVLLRIREAAETDGTPPVRSNGAPSGVLAGATTATTLSLTTNESAICKFGTTPYIPYESISNTLAMTGGTAHSSQVTGLSPGSTYSFYVRCADFAGVANLDDHIITFSIDVLPPVAVDVYIDMEAGLPGEIITPAIAAAAMRGGNGVWSTNPSPLTTFMVTAGDAKLPFPVNVGGTIYNDTGTRAWDYGHSVANSWTHYAIDPVHLKISVGAFLSTGPKDSYGYYDYIVISGYVTAQSCVVQLKDNPVPGQRAIWAHSTPQSGTQYGSPIPVVPDKLYWVSALYDSGNGVCKVAVFDTGTRQQVGATSTTQLDTSTPVRFLRFGMNAHNLILPDHSYFDDILIDWTEAKFPLGINP